VDLYHQTYFNVETNLNIQMFYKACGVAQQVLLIQGCIDFENVMILIFNILLYVSKR